MTEVIENKSFKIATLNIEAGRKYTSCICAGFHEVDIRASSKQRKSLSMNALQDIDGKIRESGAFEFRNSGTAIAFQISTHSGPRMKPLGVPMKETLERCTKRLSSLIPSGKWGVRKDLLLSRT